MAQSAIELTLDRSSDIPLGTQLAWKLRGAIASGRLAPGERLPGVRELAQEAGVNINTVRSVYARLAEQGVIVSEHGRGTFVGQMAGQGELVRLAERAAREARRSGVDPRELAALLYAEPTAAAVADRDYEVAIRRRLRMTIERLEGEHAELEAELAVLDEPAPPLPAPDKPSPSRKRLGARLLSTEALEAASEDLADRVGDLRRRLTEARDRQTAATSAPRSVAAGTPESVVSGGSWTLRWKA